MTKEDYKLIKTMLQEKLASSRSEILDAQIAIILLEKDESFWKDIIDPLLFAYDSYPGAKESGHSALSLIKGEYILIVRERV